MITNILKIVDLSSLDLLRHTVFDHYLCLVSRPSVGPCRFSKSLLLYPCIVVCPTLFLPSSPLNARPLTTFFSTPYANCLHLIPCKQKS